MFLARGNLLALIHRHGAGYVVVGLAVWVLVGLGGLVWWFGWGSASPVRSAVATAAHFQVARPVRYPVAFDPVVYTAIGDSIHIVDGDGRYRRVGEISGVYPTTGGAARRGGHVSEGEVRFFGVDIDDPDRYKLVYHRARPSAEWVVRTLIPPEKLKLIQADLARMFQEHGDEIAVHAGEMIIDSLSASMSVLAAQIPDFLRRHETELGEIGIELRDEVLAQWLPLASKHALPMAREVLEPIMLEQIMPELLAKVPWWGLARRAVQDMAGGDRFRREVARIIEEEWSQVLADHSDVLLEAAAKIGGKLAEHEEVHATLMRNISDIMESERIQTFSRRMFDQLLMENPELHNLLIEQWTGPRAEAMLSMVLDRLEPGLVDIGKRIFEDEQGGLSPEFTHIIRVMLLRQDRRWFVLEPLSAEEAARPRPAGQAGAFRIEHAPMDAAPANMLPMLQGSTWSRRP
ncbi:MAG: hypothetical protein JJU36_05165 [Phycisphaeraceae bacterium]|nr:hypothetical protein [Phycisphaeraceae bacterium]